MRQGNKLTALKISKLKQPGRYGDGHGLWLQVSESGTKSWVYRFMLNRVARHMGLGPLHTVSLQEARIRARQARQLLLEGKDPLAVKQDSLTAIKLDAAKAMTFRQAAYEFLKTSRVQSFKNPKHRKQWTATLG